MMQKNDCDKAVRREIGHVSGSTTRKVLNEIGTRRNTNIIIAVSHENEVEKNENDQDLEVVLLQRIIITEEKSTGKRAGREARMDCIDGMGLTTEPSRRNRDVRWKISFVKKRRRNGESTSKR